MARRFIPCNTCGSTEVLPLVTVRGNRGVSFIEKFHTVVVCKKCGLVFLNPQHEPEDYKKFYSSLNVPKVDTERVWTSIKEHTDDKIEIQNFLLGNIDQSSLAPKPKLLDVGCGVGAFLYHMREKGFEVEGLEPGAEERAFMEKELHITVHAGMLGDHVFREGSYDVVTALAFIEHVNNPYETLRELWRLVRPGGYLLVTTPSYHNMSLHNGPENYFKFVHTYYFSRISLSNLLRKVGFSIVATNIKEPPHKKSLLFGSVPTKGGGLLCVIGKKESGPQVDTERETAEEVIRSFENAKRKALPQYAVNLMIRNYRRLQKIPTRISKKIQKLF